MYFEEIQVPFLGNKSAHVSSSSLIILIEFRCIASPIVQGILYQLLLYFQFRFVYYCVLLKHASIFFSRCLPKRFIEDDPLLERGEGAPTKREHGKLPQWPCGSFCGRQGSTGETEQSLVRPKSGYRVGGLRWLLRKMNG